MPRLRAVTAVVFAITGACVVACAPEVGSRSLCENLRDKAAQEWTAVELETYVESCLLGEEPGHTIPADR